MGGVFDFYGNNLKGNDYETRKYEIKYWKDKVGPTNRDI